MAPCLAIGGQVPRQSALEALVFLTAIDIEPFYTRRDPSQR